MRQIIRLPSPAKTVLISTLLLIFSTLSYAADNPCRVDVFAEPDYAGKHTQITGPAEFKTLTNVNGEDWAEQIHSLKVGSKAKITVYKNTDFKLTVPEVAKSPELMNSLGVTEKDVKEDSMLIFNEDATIHDLSDFSFHKKIKSLKVECQ
jgi:hypothetical protein